MPLPHQKMREIVFLLFFARSNGMQNPSATDQLIMEQLKVSKSNIAIALEKIKAIELSLNQIDASLQKLVISYDFERIQSIEKAALRLGVYEMIFELAFPPKAIIKEALRLTKKFGTPAATSFVNAILDALFKGIQGEKTDKKEIESSWQNLQVSEKEAHEAIKSLPPFHPE